MNWTKHKTMPYIVFNGDNAKTVRTKPSPTGKYLWQHLSNYGYAKTVDEAKYLVEKQHDAREFLNYWGQLSDMVLDRTNYGVSEGEAKEMRKLFPDNIREAANHIIAQRELGITPRRTS